MRCEFNERQGDTVNARVVLLIVGVYGCLLALGTVHMSPAERADIFFSWRGSYKDQPLLVKTESKLCGYQNVFVGDGVVRVGSRCMPNEKEATHEKSAN